MMGMGGLGQLQHLLLSPLTRFAQASLIHKLLAAAAGGGLAYYLHKKGLSDTTVALAALAGAYGASMAMNYPSVAGGMPGVMPAGQALGAGMGYAMLPAANQAQVAQASRVLTSMGVRPGALAPPQPTFPNVVHNPGIPQGAPVAQGGGQWAALG
jgi:hypothetical protein